MRILQTATKPIIQPHVMVVDSLFDRPKYDPNNWWPPEQHARADLLGLTIFSVLCLVSLIIVKGPLFSVWLGSLLFVATAIGTTVAGHVMLPRYAIVLTPFLGLMMICLTASVFDIIRQSNNMMTKR